MLNAILMANNKINVNICFESKPIIKVEAITNIKSKFNCTFILTLIRFFCRMPSIDLQS